MEENTSVLWHERYGHISYQYLFVLIKTNMVDGIPPFTNVIMYVHAIKWEAKIGIHLILINQGKPMEF